MTKPKKILDEIADDNERTNSMGLFNTAEAYCRAAQDLAAQKRKVRHAEKPLEHLFIHSVELHLKALLGQLYGVAELEKKFRHNIPKLLTRPNSIAFRRPISSKKDDVGAQSCIPSR